MNAAAAKKLKVGFVSQPWDSVLPAVQRSSLPIWTAEVAGRLARWCDVIVYALRHGSQRAAETHRGVRYHRLSAAPDRYVMPAASRLCRRRRVARPLLASKLHCLGYALQAAAAMRAAHCDTAHVFNCTQFVSVIRALNPRIRIVLDMRCEWLTQLDRQLMARRIGQADAVMSCSDYLTSKSRARFPKLADRFETILTGVDTERFSDVPADRMADQDGSSRVLFVGRVSPEKGVHVLLEAFEEVVRRHPKAQLDIVGPRSACPREFICELSDDPKVAALASFYDARGYAAHLEDRLDSLHLREHVRWLGAVPYEQTPEHYRAADMVVNPSLSESLGRSLIEAMAAGKPVVATRVGGTVEIVEDGKTGLLVEADDAAAMADAICRLLADGDLRRTMGQAGRRRALDLFSWDRVAERVRLLYEKIHGSAR